MQKKFNPIPPELLSRRKPTIRYFWLDNRVRPDEITEEERVLLWQMSVWYRSRKPLKMLHETFSLHFVVPPPVLKYREFLTFDGHEGLTIWNNVPFAVIRSQYDKYFDESELGDYHASLDRVYETRKPRKFVTFDFARLKLKDIGFGLVR